MAELLRALPGDAQSESGDGAAPGWSEEGVRELGPWSALEGVDRGSYMDGWLALACRSIAGVRVGMIAILPSAPGEAVDSALWPNARARVEPLSTAIERVLERSGSVAFRCDAPDGDGGQQLAVPVQVDGRVRAVVALEIASRSEVGLALALHQLRWGCGWLEVWFRREQTGRDAHVLEQQRAALDLIACLLDREAPDQAAEAFARGIAQRLRADRVSVGRVVAGRLQLEAHSAGPIDGPDEAARHLEAAMEEALDERDPVICGPGFGDADRVTQHAHLELAERSGARALLSLRLESGARCVGALLLERDAPRAFDAEERALVAAVAAVAGPLLDALSGSGRTRVRVRRAPVRTSVRALVAGASLALLAALVPVEQRIAVEARLASGAEALGPRVAGRPLPDRDRVAMLRVSPRDLALLAPGQRGVLELEGVEEPIALALRLPLGVSANASGGATPRWIEARLDGSALPGSTPARARGRAWLGVGKRSLLWRGERWLAGWLGE